MTAAPGLPAADRQYPWDSVRACVAGIGTSGFAAADALLRFGAHVTVVDGRDGPAEQEKATVLGILGADVRLGDVPGALPPGTDLVVTSPGWRPTAALLVAAAEAGVPVWGEVELAWRLQDPAAGTRWLGVTGTNGKTTTVRMLASMLTAGGVRAAAVGNVGAPVIEAVLHPQPYQVLACELSSFQLHWLAPRQVHPVSMLAAAVLNVAPDHLDWHGSLPAYATAKGRIYQDAQVACVYNVADPATEQLVRDAEVREGCRAIGFTLGVPSVGMVGVVDDLLVDRAFIANRQTHAVELAGVADVVPAAPHNVANALAAAALARAAGVSPYAVRDGLRAFSPEPHRMATVDVVAGVRYVDDSKATNGHAAEASLGAFDPVVWIAGGLAKGAGFDDLVRRTAPRLRAAVLIGADRQVLAEALARHAPQVPVREVVSAETGDASVMDHVVRVAAGLAQPGDTVLLAPACASMDMFANYAERGASFADAVRRLAHRAAG